MRLLELKLQAFGPFTGQALDFRGGREGLHLVFGPNEAGKSTALRAVRDLLYGIPKSSDDSFLHDYKNMKIGGTLRDAAGNELEFYRLKRDKNPLRQADDKTVLDDDAIAPFLGGVSRDQFSTLFGIDHAELIRGGAEVIRGGGDVGQLLFAAGSGLAGPRQAQKTLAAELEALFKPQGQNPAINKAISEHREAIRVAQDATLPSADWERHHSALQQAQVRQKALGAELERLRAEERRLERIRKTAPRLAARREARHRLEALGAVIRLPEDFAQRRIEALTALRQAEAAEELNRRSLAELDERRATLIVPDELLAQAEELDRLRELRTKDRQGREKRPRLAALRDQARAHAQGILRELRPDLDLDAADTLRITRKRRLEVQNLGTSLETGTLEWKHAHEKVAELTRDLKELESRRNGPAATSPCDPEELETALRRVQAQGDLEAQRDRLRAEAKRAEADAQVALAQLGHWSGPLDQVEAISLPHLETVRSFEEQLQSLDADHAELAKGIERAERDREAAELQIEQCQLKGRVSTKADVEQARTVRDEAWLLVRASWLGEPSGAASLPDATELARRHEQLVGQADELSDQLFQDADRAVTLAQAKLALDRADHAIAEWTRRREGLDRRRSELETAWVEAFRPSGLTPLPPREMRAWMTDRFEALLARVRAMRQSRAAALELESTIEHARWELIGCLERSGQPRPSDDLTLAALIDRGLSLAKRLRAETQQQETAESRARDLREQLEEARTRLDSATRDLGTWRTRWAAVVEPLGLPPDVTPSQATETLRQIDELFATLKDLAKHEAELGEIDRVTQAFEVLARELTACLATDAQDQPVETTVTVLIERYQAALDVRSKREELDARRAGLIEKLEKASLETVACRTACEALCQEAGCTDMDELVEVIRQSDEAGAIQAEVRSLEAVLLDLGGGLSLEDLQAEATGIDGDTFPDRLEHVHAEITGREDELSEANRTVGLEESELARMDGAPTAAEAAERLQQIVAHLAHQAEQYARLRLASAILRDGIERYRQKNQGPVLIRAAELFSSLTAGAFSGLRLDLDDHGRPILVGLRPTSSEGVEVKGMSDGTADQLYLAVRLASLEAYLARHEPMPFIVDDILVQCDDDRAMAAIDVLAELSRRTQILMFTHHRHLVELARRRVAADVLFVHELPGRAAG